MTIIQGFFINPAEFSPMNLSTHIRHKKGNGKRVIYLDQNFISAIAKVQLGQIKDERFSAIYETLTALIEDDTIVVPESAFHTVESEWASSIIKTKALEVLKGLSRGVRVKDWREILDLQMGRALDGFFGGSFTPLSRQEAFCKIPEGVSVDVVEHLETPRLKKLSLSYVKQWRSFREKFRNKARRQLPQETLKLFKTRREEERRGLVRTYFQQPNSHECLSKYIMDAYLTNREPYEIITRYRELDSDFGLFKKFVDSKELKGVPFIDIASSLNAAIIAYEAARSPKMGDFYDVLIVGTVLPYCDALATDNFMKSLLVTRLGLDRKYGVEVFSKKGDEIDRFLEYLRHFSS